MALDKLLLPRSLRQRRKNTANLQTWFGGRFWPKIEEGLVVKIKFYIVGIDLENKSSINT